MPTIDKFIVLDRDGVINKDSDDFIKSPDEWHALDGSLEAIADLGKAGYAVYILTNQSGIARDYYTVEVLHQIHEKLRHELKAYGGSIESIYFCPHGPDDSCDCRKPLAGMYSQLQKDYPEINSFEGVPSVGDSVRDLEAAIKAGAKPILVKTGNGLKSLQILKEKNIKGLENVSSYDDLASYVHHLLK